MFGFQHLQILQIIMSGWVLSRIGVGETLLKLNEKYEFGRKYILYSTGDVMNKIGEGGEYNEI